MYKLWMHRVDSLEQSKTLQPEAMQMLKNDVMINYGAWPDIERHPVVAHREVMYSGIIDDEVRFKASVRMDGDYGGSAFISYVIVRINQYGSENKGNPGLL